MENPNFRSTIMDSIDKTKLFGNTIFKIYEHNPLISLLIPLKGALYFLVNSFISLLIPLKGPPCINRRPVAAPSTGGKPSKSSFLGVERPAGHGMATV